MKLNYDYYIVAFSGGKDSTASVLHLLDRGVPKSKIELWHHDIDGNGPCFMDWPITKSYCLAFAEALDLKIYMSWKEGGFYREMMRDNTPTAPISFEIPHTHNEVKTVGGKGPNGTRLKFPQVTADLKTRWCSAYLKIDVGAAALRNQSRFQNKKTLFITGERREESSARAKYNMFEPDRADLRNGKVPRHVDHWRPIIEWKEKQVWKIIEKHGIVPHPAYYAGWGRLSCLFCIFGNANQFRSAQAIHPENFKKICDCEKQFNLTIKRKKSLPELIKDGKIYPALLDFMGPGSSTILWKDVYDEPIFTSDWMLPAGAFGDSTGPS